MLRSFSEGANIYQRYISYAQRADNLKEFTRADNLEEVRQYVSHLQQSCHLGS